MKTYKIIIMLFSILPLLMACEPEMYFFDDNYLLEETVKIELIEYDTDDIDQIKSEDEILPYDFNNETIIDTLDINENSDIFQEISNIEFHRTVKYSRTPIGISLKITYRNGDFAVISSELIDNINYGGAILFDSSGSVIEFLGNFATRQQFVDLVNRYFDTSID